MKILIVYYFNLLDKYFTIYICVLHQYINFEKNVVFAFNLLFISIMIIMNLIDFDFIIYIVSSHFIVV